MPRLITLPTKNDPLQEQVVSLDGSSFTIVLDWSERTNNWAFRISDAAGNLLTSGGNMVPFTDLLRNVAGENRPGGALFLVTQGTDATPGLENLSLALLAYYTKAELGRG